jgi:hypothetical protein
MPKPRIQVESGLRTPGLQPVARQTDTFIPGAAATGASQGLQQLATGLSNINATVGKFAVQVQERANERALERGKRAARSALESQKSYASAVKDGTIKSTENPWYMAGAQMEFGRQVAHMVQSDALAEVAGIYESGGTVSPQQWDEIQLKHAQNRRAQFAGTEWDTEAFENGFGDTNAALRMNERENISRRFTGQIETQDTETFGSNQPDETLHGIQNGLSNAEIAEGIQQRLDEKVSGNEGLAGAYTDQTVEALVRLAKYGDRYGLSMEERRRALQIADELRGDKPELGEKRPRVAAGRKAGEKIGAAWDYLDESATSELRAMNAAEQREVANGKKTFQQEYNELTRDNPNAEIPETVWDRWQLDAADVHPDLEDFVKNYKQNHGKGVDDFPTIDLITSRLLDGTYTPDEIRAQIAEQQRIGKLTNGTALDLLARLDKLRPNGFSQSDISGYDQALKLRHYGGDYVPGITNAQLEQYQKASRFMKDYLMDGVDENGNRRWDEYVIADEARQRQMEFEAYQAAVGAYESLRVTGEPTKVKSKEKDVDIEEIVDVSLGQYNVVKNSWDEAGGNDPHLLSDEAKEILLGAGVDINDPDQKIDAADIDAFLSAQYDRLRGKL